MFLLEKSLAIFDKRPTLNKTIDWVKNNRVKDSGIAVHHKTKNVTQEVTGYLITSLFNAGEKEFALELARWEASVQQPNGGFLAPDGFEYTFDTAQVMRGFLTVLNELPQIELNLRKAADFVAGKIDEKGKVHTTSYNSWKLPDGTYFSSYCDLYNLSPLMEAGKILKEQKYIDAANRALNFFKSKPDLVEFKPELGTLSHIFGYMMEALADMGEYELAKKGLAQAARIQKEDGLIPAFPGVEWICSPGIAQLGLAWYKVGERERAARALKYLEKIQNTSGGWYASFGKGAQYLPGKEVSWTNKFFIDLSLLMDKE